MRNASALAWTAVVALVCLVPQGCSRGDDPPSTSPVAAPAPSATSDAGSPRPDSLRPTVIFETKAGDVRVEVEVARTQRDIQQGLMYRRHMDWNHGMIFLMGDEKIQSFWMKNTLISLDMIFVRADHTVAGVVENAEPQTLESRRLDVPSTYVVEVNGGFAAKNGIGAGAVARFENFEP